MSEPLLKDIDLGDPTIESDIELVREAQIQHEVHERARLATEAIEHAERAKHMAELKARVGHLK